MWSLAVRPLNQTSPHPTPANRNYHVFYYLLAGASDEKRRNFKLLNPKDYVYLKQVRKSRKRFWKASRSRHELSQSRSLCISPSGERFHRG